MRSATFLKDALVVKIREVLPLRTEIKKELIVSES